MNLGDLKDQLRKIPGLATMVEKAEVQERKDEDRRRAELAAERKALLADEAAAWERRKEAENKVAASRRALEKCDAYAAARAADGELAQAYYNQAAASARMNHRGLAIERELKAIAPAAYLARLELLEGLEEATRRQGWGAVPETIVARLDAIRASRDRIHKLILEGATDPSQLPPLDALPALEFPAPSPS